ncbi:hypothetical protein NPIL_525531 [Nephila pilipes]|uniref:Uncharacterized protein n=1 Tax=Nephila pilipes TaxID=299642 RepID=A0A8X6JR60_NEPPI|nr:hypothetical protein NPIL_525531 [Nephila pilipes]
MGLLISLTYQLDMIGKKIKLFGDYTCVRDIFAIRDLTYHSADNLFRANYLFRFHSLITSSTQLKQVDAGSAPQVALLDVLRAVRPTIEMTQKKWICPPQLLQLLYIKKLPLLKQDLSASIWKSRKI